MRTRKPPASEFYEAVRSTKRLQTCAARNVIRTFQTLQSRTMVFVFVTFESVKDWVSRFSGIVVPALKDRPDLLAKMGLKPRGGQR